MAVGRMAYDMSYYSQAARHFRKALEIAKAANLPADELAKNQVSLGKTLACMGNYHEAEHCLEAALSLDEGVNAHGLDTASDYTELGLLYFKTGRLAQAEDYNKRAVDLLKSFKTAPADLVTKALKQLAIVRSENGDLDGAMVAADEAIAIFENSSLSKNHLIYGEALMVKTILLVEKGDNEAAKEIFWKAMQIVELNRGPFHPKVATMMDMFSEMTAQAGKKGASDYLHRRAEEIRQAGRKPHN